MCDTVVEETAVDTSNTVINAADTAELLTEQVDGDSKLSSKAAAVDQDVRVTGSNTMDAVISTTVSTNSDTQEELYTNIQQISGEYALACKPFATKLTCWH